MAEFPAWLVKNVMIQGYMLLTEHHICFYAPLPKTDVCQPFQSLSTNIRAPLSSRGIYLRNLAPHRVGIAIGSF